MGFGKRLGFDSDASDGRWKVRMSVTSHHGGKL